MAVNGQERFEQRRTLDRLRERIDGPKQGSTLGDLIYVWGLGSAR